MPLPSKKLQQQHYAASHKVMETDKIPLVSISNKHYTPPPSLPWWRRQGVWLVVVSIVAVVAVFGLGLAESKDETSTSSSIRGAGGDEKEEHIVANGETIEIKHHDAATTTTEAETQDDGVEEEEDDDDETAKDGEDVVEEAETPATTTTTAEAETTSATTTDAGTAAVPTTGDTSLIDTMISNFATAKEAFHKTILEPDYGTDYFSKIFGDVEMHQKGQFILSSVNPTLAPEASAEAPKIGWERVKRKLKLKILQRLVDLKNGVASPPLQPFIWATGGHSASAAHGDFMNQSYTAYLERALTIPGAETGVFEAAGLQFLGRNYAMGGMSSAPELGMCLEEIYGLDIDVLSWDYGMTDGNHYENRVFYFSRAGMHPNRPATVTIQIGSHDRTFLTDILDLEQRGLPTLYLNDTTVRFAMAQLPDCADIPAQNLDQLPRYIRNFKCGNGIEKGEPFCDSDKFVNEICNTRRWRVSWHPGWKWHALYGNLLATALIEMLGDALIDIKNNPGQDYAGLYATLKAQEDQEYATFAKSELTSQGTNTPLVVGSHPVDLNSVYKLPSLCHSGYLPAQSRYLGVLLDDGRVIGPDMFDYVNVKDGMLVDDAARNPNNGSDMRLCYDTEDRQICEVPLNIDMKDYWFVQGTDLPQVISLPNRAEVQMYQQGKPPLQGMVIACILGCPWFCGKSDVRSIHIFPTNATEAKQAEIKVNGKLATNATIWNECMFLSHEGGLNWDPNSAGQFDIEVNVFEPENHIRFTSFIIY